MAAHSYTPNQTHAEVTRDVVATLGAPARGYVMMLAGAAHPRAKPAARRNKHPHTA